MITKEELTPTNLHKSDYGWPLQQLRIPESNTITRGSADVVVAVIDLGYTPHPSHEPHLWRNPSPQTGDIHGWDFEDDDVSLEYRGHREEAFYQRNHHCFIVGEVIACAPECPVMVLRVGYENPDSWGNAIEYAVDHGASIIVLPHGFISHGTGAPIPLFYMGTDFGYPVDNPLLRKSFDHAYEAGCLICKGTADNRGRRVAGAMVGHDVVFPVGSSNRSGAAADICPSTDYALGAAPGGERSSDNEIDYIWSPGADGKFVSFTGGCMASGFAGGVAALVKSRFPDVSIEELKMILRNTASGEGWNPRTGFGILDAFRAVSLDEEQLQQNLRIDPDSAELTGRRRKRLKVRIRNDGVLDVRRAIAVAYDGDPLTPADPDAKRNKPATLLRRQIGHTILPVRGLHTGECDIELDSPDDIDPGEIHLQVSSLDHHGSYQAHTARLSL